MNIVYVWSGRKIGNYIIHTVLKSLLVFQMMLTLIRIVPRITFKKLIYV